LPNQLINLLRYESFYYDKNAGGGKFLVAQGRINLTEHQFDHLKASYYRDDTFHIELHGSATAPNDRPADPEITRAIKAQAKLANAPTAFFEEKLFEYKGIESKIECVRTAQIEVDDLTRCSPVVSRDYQGMRCERTVVSGCVEWQGSLMRHQYFLIVNGREITSELKSEIIEKLQVKVRDKVKEAADDAAGWASGRFLACVALSLGKGIKPCALGAVNIGLERFQMKLEHLLTSDSLLASAREALQDGLAFNIKIEERQAW